MNATVAPFPPPASTSLLDDVLRCPLSGRPMRRLADACASPSDAEIRFQFDDGVLRAALADDGARALVAHEIKAFYAEHPFPNYDELETVGSLIEKSLARGFPEMLNRSIPPHARVLEAGCGTGQLGNFLSIAQRRVLSVDMCLNSLRLGQRFKHQNQLTGVTFAQMNLFRLPLRPASFDVVICTGVLHHTADPHEGYRRLLTLVRPGGHINIGLYNRYARLQTRLRGLLLRLMGERFARLDPYLRQHPMAEGKFRAWFMDQYRNPHESLHTIDEVLRWFDASGMHFVRALPGTIFGSRFALDYRRSLFEDEPRGSHADRLLAQCHAMLTDTEGGLFIMIGRTPGGGGPRGVERECPERS